MLSVLMLDLFVLDDLFDDVCDVIDVDLFC